MAYFIKDEETNFMLMFQKILDEIISLNNIQSEAIEIAISEAFACFHNYKFPDVYKKEHLCAYLFRYASHGAGLVRKRLLEAIRDCSALESSLKVYQVSNSSLRIISLGGGPGNDAIGLCSALFDFGVRNASLEITVVDKYNTWSDSVTRAENLIRNDEFGNVTQLFRCNEDRIMSFLQVNLPGNRFIHKNYFERLKNADIILMVKLISILDLGIVFLLFQNLLENMKKDAIILYIDVPNRVVDPYLEENFDVLYKSPAGIEYISSARCPPRFNSNDYVTSLARMVVLRIK